MKERYESLEIEVIKFDGGDVITDSIPDTEVTPIGG